MSVLERFLQGAGALTAQAVVQRVLGAITSIVLARGLGSTGFGAYSAVVNTASSAYGMVRFGVDAAVHVYTAKGTPDETGRRRTGELLGAGLGILSIAGFAAALVLVAAGEWVASAIFGQPSLTTPLRFAGLLTALQCLSQFSYATLAGFQAFVVYARMMMVNAVLTLVLCATGMMLYGLAGALGGFGLSQAFLAASLWHEAAIALRKRDIRLACSGMARSAATLLRLGMPFYISGLVSVPAVFYLQGLLSRTEGIDALGVLRVIGTVTGIVAFIPGSVAAVTTSTLAAVRAESGVASSKVFDYAFLHVKVVAYLTLVASGSLAVLMPIVIQVLYGAEYAIAVEPGVVALFSIAISSTAGAVGSLFFAIERSIAIFWQFLWQFLFLMGAGLVLVPVAGVLGYIGAEFAGNLAGLVFVMFAALRLAGRNWRNSQLGHVLAIGVVSALACIFFALQVSTPFIRVLAILLIMIVTTLGVLRFGLNPWERSIVSQMASRILVGKRR